jgi:Flp pilus assembly protein TadG
MFAGLGGFISNLVARFRDDQAATITTTFALTMIPIMSAVGAAVDYSRANSVRSNMQAALDAAVLAGARDGSSNWAQVAGNVFDANSIATGLAFSKGFPAKAACIKGARRRLCPRCSSA